MNRVLGIVLIFAAAWLMFKLQAGNDSSNEEEPDSPDADPENRLGRALELRQESDRQQDEETPGEEDSGTGRQDKS